MFPGFRKQNHTPLRPPAIPSTKMLYNDRVVNPSASRPWTKSPLQGSITINVRCESKDTTMLWQNSNSSKRLYPSNNALPFAADFGQVVFTYNHPSLRTRPYASGRCNLGGLGSLEGTSTSCSKEEIEKSMRILASEITVFGLTNNVYTNEGFNVENGVTCAISGNHFIRVDDIKKFEIGGNFGWALPEKMEDDLHHIHTLKLVPEKDILGLNFFSQINNDMLRNYIQMIDGKKHDLSYSEAKKKSYESIVKGSHINSLVDGLLFLQIMLDAGIVVMPKENKQSMIPLVETFSSSISKGKIDMRSLFSEGIGRISDPNAQITSGELLLRLAYGMNLLKTAPDHTRLSQETKKELENIRYTFLAKATYDGTFQNFEFENMNKSSVLSPRDAEGRINIGTSEGEFLKLQLNSKNLLVSSFLDAEAQRRSRVMGKVISAVGTDVLQVVLGNAR